MLFVEICVFSVSTMTVFQSWFLIDGNVVLFSDMILFKISTLLFSSCVSVTSIMFGCVVFWLLLLGISIWLAGSAFSVVSVSVTALVSSWHVCQFICWCISNISRSENQLFFIIVPTWSPSLWVVLNQAYSSQISIVPFLYTLCVGLLQKLLWSTSLLSSLVHFLCWCLWFDNTIK